MECVDNIDLVRTKFSVRVLGKNIVVILKTY